MPMPREFTIGPECLIGYVLRQPIALPARTTNLNQSIETKFHPTNGKKTVAFRTIHIDHKGPIQPNNASNVHCLLIIDAFSRFLMV